MTALTWAEYKTVIKRTILKDASGLIATNERLADAARWAFSGLLVHTALPKTVTYVGDGSTYQFSLPNDLYVPLDQAGLVMVYDTPTTETIYLKPAYSTFDIAATDQSAFSVWPSDTLETGMPPPTNTTLIVRYYAYFPYMVNDTDVMPIPEWAYTAVGYDIGVHLITAQSWEEAMNAGNKTKPDSGTPENNSLRQVQKWWIQVYERELNRHPKQQRIVSPR